jgi:hypothetical protein
MGRGEYIIKKDSFSQEHEKKIVLRGEVAESGRW